MSPAAKRSKKAKAAKVPKAARKPAKAKAKPVAKSAAKGKPGKPERRHCAASDPFGGPCQSVPRLPSKYCTIHSYLDR